MEMGTLTAFTCSGYSHVVSSSAHVNELKTWCSHSSVPEIQVFWDVMFCHRQSIADISKNHSDCTFRVRQSKLSSGTA